MNCPFSQKSSRRLEPGDNTWIHRLFSTLYCQLNPGFQKYLCPAQSPILKGVGEREITSSHQTFNWWSSNLYTHTPPCKLKSSCKQTAGLESEEKHGNRRTPQSPTSLVCSPKQLMKIALSPGVCREAGKEAAPGPAEREQAQPALRSCPSQIFQKWNCSQVPAHAWRISWTAFPFFFGLLWNRTLSVLQYGFVSPARSYWAVSSYQWETHVSSVDLLPCNSARGVGWAHVHNHKGNGL